MSVLLLVTSSAHVAHAEPPGAADNQAAQPVPESPLRSDARLMGFVVSPFGGNAGGAGFGFGIGVNIGLQRIPITVGVDVLTAFWGSETSRIQVRAGNMLVPVDRTRDDHGYFLDASLRLQPIDWLFRPYVEGFVGTKLLETSYTLSFPDTGTSTGTTSDHDWAGSIGWGAGLDLGSVRQGALNLTLGFRRLSGAEASFSRAADVNGDVIVRYAAPTSCMIYMLGLAGSFGVAGAASP